MNFVIKVAGRIIPNNLKKSLWEIYILILLKIQPIRYAVIRKKISKKKIVKIVFLIQLSSSWKYDYLFKSLQKVKKFEPLIIICPLIGYDNDNMFKEMQMAVDFFLDQGYPVLSTWDAKNEIWLDVRKEINPDIVFFSNPWAELSLNKYYIYNFLDKLTCYVPYGFKSSHLYEAIFDKPFQNLLWRIFYETEIHKCLAKKYARNMGINGVVTGYPGMDNLLDKYYIPKDEWKIQNNTVRRIIWAPHHTIFGKSDSNVGFSTFLLYSDLMLRIANEYEEKIQISFKPHPLLRPKLYNHTDWGILKTDNYFEKWASLKNGQLNEGNYIDLFMTSDAIINDGESFMVEYLYTKKPAMFLVADKNISDRFNEFGKLVFKQLYQGHSEQDIREFINMVIIGGNDHMKEERVGFFEKYVKPPNDKLASENLFSIIMNAVYRDYSNL